MSTTYSSLEETKLITDLIRSLVPLPEAVGHIVDRVSFAAVHDFPYFPIPFKETETAAALKAIEASFIYVLNELRESEAKSEVKAVQSKSVGAAPAITIRLEKATAFLFQAYLARLAGYRKLDPEVKKYLVDTDLLKAQSIAYRRMSANLYETKEPHHYYHIHGSLEASTTLRMIGLEPFRPDLTTHDDIVHTIEGAVRKFTVKELEALNAQNKQAGVPVLKHDEFLQTPHGKLAMTLPPWDVVNLEHETPPKKLPPIPTSAAASQAKKPLAGIRVLELCRIIAGPTMGRILAEYGADVLKITSPKLSDVPFFQVDGNMGKHAAALDLKTPEGMARFRDLARDADIVLDGYRPGALSRLGVGPEYMAALAKERGYGVVYVNENCFGYQGEWASRPGWQQIADCASGLAWEQGRFMGLDEPVVPPFPISDYGTGCMGAIAALTGLYRRATEGGSWHGMASLVQYDLLLFKAGLYPPDVQAALHAAVGPEFAAMRHSHSVDQISGSALLDLERNHPDLFSDPAILETWHSAKYGNDIVVVRPVAEIEGLELGFDRASRPNGSDEATWDFGADAGDYKK